jgi:hypothetical protein
MLCGMAFGGVAFWGVASAATAPGAAPPPAARPGIAAPVAAEAVVIGGVRMPVPRPRVATNLTRSRTGGTAAAPAFDPTPRPQPRPTGVGAVPPQDLTATAAKDMADDGPVPTHGATAPGEITGGTRDGFASTGLALIGIFGAPGDWRALVRMPAGKVDYVHVGARLGGWQVAAISAKQVQLVRGLQSRMLTVPDH